jgi:hypothetical protein
MLSKTFSIGIVASFLAGVATWYGARFWTFGQFRPLSTGIAIVLAIALATSVARGNVFSRGLTLMFSAFGAYSSFHLFTYARSRTIIVDSQEITGDAFLLPGVFFSLCAALVLISWLGSYLRNRRTAERQTTE